MYTLLLASALASPKHLHTEVEPTHVSPDGLLVRVVLHQGHADSCVIEHRRVLTDELVGPAVHIEACEPGRFGQPDLLSDERDQSWIALDEADLSLLGLRVLWFQEDLSPGQSRGGILLVSASEAAALGG
mgnify:CR=1 FL=1